VPLRQRVYDAPLMDLIVGGAVAAAGQHIVETELARKLGAASRPEALHRMEAEGVGGPGHGQGASVPVPTPTPKSTSCSTYAPWIEAETQARRGRSSPRSVRPQLARLRERRAAAQVREAAEAERFGVAR